MLNGRQMVKSTATITFFLSLNILVGLLTQIILAAKFGARFEMDAYLAAVTLPTLIIVVLMNSLRVTFIPVLLSMKKRKTIRKFGELPLILLIPFLSFYFLLLL